MGTPVALTGVPISPGKYGSTDTIVVRPQDAVFSGHTATTPIQMEALAMTGTYSGCTVSVTLASGPASTGIMTLTTTSAKGGTFNSTLNVYYLAMFTPPNPGVGCPPPVSGTVKLVQNGGSWETKPISKTEFLVKGKYGDVQANKHSELPVGYRDFFIEGIGQEAGPTHIHAVCEATIQEISEPCSESQ
jgi:hypothetical protein